jgi:ribosomal protein S18 acetylase RimI-like enzyme
MNILDRQDWFYVCRLELSDQSLIEGSAQLFNESLGSYHPTSALSQKICDKHTFLLCAVERETQEPIGIALGWNLGKEYFFSLFKKYVGSVELPIGYFKSLAVMDSCRGKGIGSILIENIVDCFRTSGYHHLVTEAWSESPKSAINLLNKAGFQTQSTIPNYWYEESCNMPEFCVKCGTPCRCSAQIMTKSLNPYVYEKVKIRQADQKGAGVFATHSLKTGERVFVGKPIYTEKERTHYSIQTSWDRHALFNRPAVLTNHSCEPNCGIRDNQFGGFDFVAMRDIALGEEITWDYAMSEYVSISVPNCQCRSSHCRGSIGGWRKIPESIREKYKNFSASYLHQA